ncbi:hypothetical protein K8I61_05900 [bacterium]|nr:hypothetical protein [bacterium]
MTRRPAAYAAVWSRRMKRALFALIPASVLLIAATWLLSGLERRDAIRTETADELAHFGPARLFGDFATRDADVIVVRHPMMNAMTMPAKKSGYRIVTTGGSFAMGSPYNFQGNDDVEALGIPDWIRETLKAAPGGAPAEVPNLAAGGQDSTAVAEIVRQTVATIDPDLVVVMTGNNEGFGAPTALNEPLHRWVLYRTLKRGLLPDIRPEERSYFTAARESEERLERRYVANIRKMVAACRDAGVELLLATLPINYRYWPESPQKIGIDFDPLDDPAAREGIDLAREGKFDAAIERFAEVRHQGASLRLLAEAYERRGDFGRAREFYRLYVASWSINRMRPHLNDRLRRIARETGVPLVDLEAAYEATAPWGLGDPKLFVDVCHMTWRGYYLMAQAVMDAMRDANLPAAARLAGARPEAEAIIEASRWNRKPERLMIEYETARPWVSLFDEEPGSGASAD